MSLPILSFTNLSIDTMPTTRAQSISSRMDMPDDRDTTQDEDEYLSDASSEAEEDIADSTIIKSPSQLWYDIRNLSPATKSRVQDAFKNGRFDVDHCVQADPNRDDGYYAFQVAETTIYPVRIGRPLSRFPTPRCFVCGDVTDLQALSGDEYAQLTGALDRVHNSSNASQLRRVYEFVDQNGMLHDDSTTACRHIYWLMDQIAGYTLQKQDDDSVYSLSTDGAVVGAGPPFEQISRIGLTNLAGEKNWRFKGNISHVLSHSSSSLDLGSAVDRLGETRDIISALSFSVRPEIFDDVPQPLLEADVLVPNDIEATLARSLLYSDACFNFFKSAIPSNYRAEAVFRRLGEEAKTSLSRLDEYIASASQRGAIPTHDVAMTAQELKDIVALIEQEYENRSHGVGLQARKEAARVLVSILNAVVGRDQDVYAGLRRPRIPIPQRASERNIYQLLIVSDISKAKFHKSVVS